MARSNIIFIRGLKLDMNIGIFEHEKKGKQPVLVDAEISLDSALAWRRDDIRETVAYDDLTARIEKISALKHYELLETFLETAADDILKLPKVASVKISAEKPGIIKNADAVGVSITRNK